MHSIYFARHGMTFWNQDDDEEKTDADDNGK